MPTNYVRNLVWNGSYDVVIYSTKPEISIQPGNYACKMGHVTGYACGQITAVNLPQSCPGPQNVCYSGMFEMMPSGWYGDSGGPVMNGSEAWGIIHSIVTSNNNRIRFMPVQRISENQNFLITWWIP
jgi:hypothetical protein